MVASAIEAPVSAAAVLNRIEASQFLGVVEKSASLFVLILIGLLVIVHAESPFVNFSVSAPSIHSSAAI